MVFNVCIRPTSSLNKCQREGLMNTRTSMSSDININIDSVGERFRVNYRVASWLFDCISDDSPEIPVTMGQALMTFLTVGVSPALATSRDTVLALSRGALTNLMFRARQ